LFLAPEVTYTRYLIAFDADHLTPK
jgi:hypothetical protein